MDRCEWIAKRQFERGGKFCYAFGIPRVAFWYKFATCIKHTKFDMFGIFGTMYQNTSNHTKIIPTCQMLVWYKQSFVYIWYALM